MASYAQKSNYYVIFGSERLKNLKYYLQKCSLPSITLPPVPYKSRFRTIKLAGSEIEYSPLSLQILVDENFTTYVALLDEIMSYKNPETGVINIKPFDMSLFATSNKGNPILEFKYSNCYVTNITEYEFNDTENSENIQIILTIEYENITYSRKNESLNDMIEIPFSI